jgi:hypothetical protein
MQLILQAFLYAVGLPLELLVIAAILKSRAWRTFPFIFAYAVALFITSVVEIPAYIAYFAGIHHRRSRAFFYWINEGVLQILIFAAVISLIYHATSALRNRTTIRRALVAGAVLFAPLSLALHYDPNAVVGQWMTLVSRDLNLCTAVLDLALWMILLAFRPGDHRLLLLSGGLGVQFAGEAIGHSLRQVSRVTVLLGSVVVVLANLACLYVWWQTFRTSEASSAALQTAERGKAG